MDEQERTKLISDDPKSRDVIYPYLNGSDLNNSFDNSASRWTINFNDWSEEKARSYSSCFDRIENSVKKERQEKKEEKLRRLWWQYARRADDLYSKVTLTGQCLPVNSKEKLLS